VLTSLIVIGAIIAIAILTAKKTPATSCGFGFYELESKCLKCETDHYYDSEKCEVIDFKERTKEESLRIVKTGNFDIEKEFETED